jgi:hypothetical protein
MLVAYYDTPDSISCQLVNRDGCERVNRFFAKIVDSGNEKVYSHRRSGMAAIVFLPLNGIDLEADEAQLEKIVLDATQDKAGNGAVIRYLYHSFVSFYGRLTNATESVSRRPLGAEGFRSTYGRSWMRL